MLIEDGVGKGFKLKVDDENMAHVLAITLRTAEHVNEAHGEAYTMDIDGIQTDGVNYWFAIIKNTGDTDMHIAGVNLWVPSFRNTQIMEFLVGGTFTYATNGTAVTPTNCNASSGKTATGDFYVNDGSGNITTVVAGSIVGRAVFNTTPSVWIPISRIILPKNSCFMLRSDEAEKFTGCIEFFYHNMQ